jgi:hypothetical protein
MSGKKMRIRWTMEAREIPQDWVRLTTFGYDKASKKPSDEYKTIYSCIQQGLISPDDCIKFRLTPTDDRGPIYIKPSAAADALAKYAAPFAARRAGGAAANQPLNPEPSRWAYVQGESAIMSLHGIEQRLACIEQLLDRLATAAESIATQPKNMQQELLHTMNGNGFHN